MFLHQSRFGRTISQILIVFALVLIVLPLALMVNESLQAQGLSNYLSVLKGTPFFTFIRNSAIISFTTVLIVLVVSISSAYAVDLLRPRGSFILSLLILAGLALPTIAIVVPLFYLVQLFGLFDTYWAVIIPLTAASIPFGVLVSGNYIRSLPIEIYEAAKIDGASSFRFLVSILIPICRPILSVIAIFTFLSAWNEYVLPLIFIQNVHLQVATQVPTYFQTQHLTDMPKVFAANILISVPVLFLYLLLQKQFRRGLSAGTVK